MTKQDDQDKEFTDLLEKHFGILLKIAGAYTETPPCTVAPAPRPTQLSWESGDGYYTIPLPPSFRKTEFDQFFQGNTGIQRKFFECNVLDLRPSTVTQMRCPFM